MKFPKFEAKPQYAPEDSIPSLQTSTIRACGPCTTAGNSPTGKNIAASNAKHLVIRTFFAEFGSLLQTVTGLTHSTHESRSQDEAPEEDYFEVRLDCSAGRDSEGNGGGQ